VQGRAIPGGQARGPGPAGAGKDRPQRLGELFRVDAGAALANPGERPLESRLGHRLEQIVDRRELECLDGVLVVGGHEHHRRHARPGCELQTGLLGHLNVEQHDVGLVRGDDEASLGGVGSLAHNGHVTDSFEHPDETAARRSLVVDHDRAHQ